MAKRKKRSPASGKSALKKKKSIKKERGGQKDICVVLAGEAGQGIQSIETILVNVLKKDGYNVFATKEYMSRIRGGVNSTEIRISDK